MPEWTDFFDTLITAFGPAGAVVIFLLASACVALWRRMNKLVDDGREREVMAAENAVRTSELLRQQIDLLQRIEARQR